MSKELFKRVLSSIILIPLSFYFITQGSYLVIFFTIILFMLSCYEWHRMSINKPYQIYGFIFLIISFYTFYELTIEVIQVIFVILICVSTDLGGYIFGKILKGPKLTKISPNKTYAGMVGGYICSFLSLIIYMNFINNSGSLVYLFLITFLISSVSQIGDIIISYYKRLSKIKKTGELIPGHGGLLDRIDGMIFAFPIYYLVDLISYMNI